MNAEPPAPVPPRAVPRLGVDDDLAGVTGEDLDRLFRGETPLDDAVLGPLVPLMGALRDTPFIAGDAWLRESVAAAADTARKTNVTPLPTSGHRRRVWVGVAAAAATVAFTAGLAAADTLPRPLQAAASRAVATIGLTLPNGADGEQHGTDDDHPSGPAPSTTPGSPTRPDAGAAGAAHAQDPDPSTPASTSPTGRSNGDGHAVDPSTSDREDQQGDANDSGRETPRPTTTVDREGDHGAPAPTSVPSVPPTTAKGSKGRAGEGGDDSKPVSPQGGAPASGGAGTSGGAAGTPAGGDG
jgi:hypothetical protein